MQTTTPFGRRGVPPGSTSPSQGYRQDFQPGPTTLAGPPPGRNESKGGPLGFAYFIDAITTNYINFSDDTDRKSFWMYMLYYFVFLIFSIIASLSLRSLLPFQLYNLAIFLPDLGVKVRRLHDVGKTGWWFLIAFVPFGAFYLLYLWVQPSEPSSTAQAEVFA
jgi:hypothetical protein